MILDLKLQLANRMVKDVDGPGLEQKKGMLLFKTTYGHYFLYELNELTKMLRKIKKRLSKFSII